MKKSITDYLKAINRVKTDRAKRRILLKLYEDAYGDGYNVGVGYGD